jgi:hypothetical protein
MFGKALIWIAKEAAPLVPHIRTLVTSYLRKDRQAALRALIELEAEVELREMEERRGG